MTTPILSKKKVTDEELRRLIAKDSQAFFPFYISGVIDESLYTKKRNEILFLSEANSLNYVKVLDADESGLFETLADDYLKLKERWDDYRANNQYTAMQFQASIDVLVVAERFDEAFMRRLKLLSIASIRFFQIQVLSDSLGALSYLVEELVEGKSVALPVARVEKKVKSRPQPQAVTPKMEKAKPVKPVKEANVVETKKTSILTDAVSGPSFFERAKLSKEEEQAFVELQAKVGELSSGELK